MIQVIYTGFSIFISISSKNISCRDTQKLFIDDKSDIFGGSEKINVLFFIKNVMTTGDYWAFTECCRNRRRVFREGGARGFEPNKSDHNSKLL